MPMNEGQWREGISPELASLCTNTAAQMRCGHLLVTAESSLVRVISQQLWACQLTLRTLSGTQDNPGTSIPFWDHTQQGHPQLSVISMALLSTKESLHLPSTAPSPFHSQLYPGAFSNSSAETQQTAIFPSVLNLLPRVSQYSCSQMYLKFLLWAILSHPRKGSECRPFASRTHHHLVGLLSSRNFLCFPGWWKGVGGAFQPRGWGAVWLGKASLLLLSTCPPTSIVHASVLSVLLKPRCQKLKS